MYGARLESFLIIHAGQTGVERGAHEAARHSGLAVAGFTSRDGRDELARLPSDILDALTPHPDKGLRVAIASNVEIASAALIVVPDVQDPTRCPPMAWLLNRVRARHIPLLVCDGRSSVSDAAAWACEVPESSGSRRLLVTGPRATRWPDGEKVARRLVAAIADTVVPAHTVQRASLVADDDVGWPLKRAL